MKGEDAVIAQQSTDTWVKINSIKILQQSLIAFALSWLSSEVDPLDRIDILPDGSIGGFVRSFSGDTDKHWPGVLEVILKRRSPEPV